MSILTEDLSGLSSAEDFLQTLGIAYDARVVAVNRLHILKRFGVYLAQEKLADLPAEGRKSRYRAALARAYNDFVASSAQAQKVFPVFRRGESAFVALSAIGPAPHNKA